MGHEQGAQPDVQQPRDIDPAALPSLALPPLHNQGVHTHTHSDAHLATPSRYLRHVPNKLSDSTS